MGQTSYPLYEGVNILCIQTLSLLFDREHIIGNHSATLVKFCQFCPFCHDSFFGPQRRGAGDTPSKVADGGAVATTFGSGAKAANSHWPTGQQEGYGQG